MTLNTQVGRGRRVVEITSDYPGSVLPSDLFKNPRTMLLQQRLKSHDVLTLMYETELKDATRLLRTGAPVTVTWGTTGIGESYTWVGYVHTTRPRRLGNNSSGQTEVVCVSPSMILKQAAQDTWIDQPIMDAAYDIISRSGLRGELEMHPMRDTLLQHGRTYWQVLREIAGLTGYSLTTDNTDVIMVPHKQFFDVYAPRARVFSPGSTMEIDPSMSGRSLYSFVPDWSDLSEDEYALHVSHNAWSIDPRTGATSLSTAHYPTDLISSTREFPNVSRYSSRASYTPTDASRLVGDTLADRRWINQATLVGLGSPDISPYRPVYVDGVSESVDGWWQVLAVEHEVTNRAEYTATMRVGRDGGNVSYPKPSTSPTLPDAEIARRSWTTPSAPQFVTTSSTQTQGLMGFGDVGGRWVSARTG